MRASAPRSASERGFTLVELLVVLVIAAVLGMIALPALKSARESSGGPVSNVGAGEVWRGIQAWRIDNHGQYPPPALLEQRDASGHPGAGLTDPSGKRYIKWPTDSNGQPLKIVTQTTDVQGWIGSLPQASPARANTVVYTRTTGESVAALAGYDPKGRLNYRRGTSNSVQPIVRPLG